MPNDLIGVFRWQDFIDIAVVAFIIYKTLMLLVGTRAVQLVKGLFLIGVLAFLARWLNLDMFSWLLSKAMSVLLIAVPIVFQPELRKILEELGRGGMWRQRKAMKQAETVADSVTKALMYLRSHKIGALMVLQRTTGLKDFWRTAVLLNAEVSQELIIDLFWPNNPLHDGAVIIDTERIIAAGCYLPLTENADLSRWLGTRHRAAIGVTEVSDAMSLVVSEERGEVSLAINGHLSRDLREEQVKKLLVHYFSEHDQEQQSFLENLRDELRSLGNTPQP